MLPTTGSTSASRFGLDTMVHVLPFHDSTSVRGVSGSPTGMSYQPTARQAVGDEQETFCRLLRVALGLGLGTTDHALPFQDSTRVSCGSETPGAKWNPVAMHAVVELQET